MQRALTNIQSLGTKSFFSIYGLMQSPQVEVDNQQHRSLQYQKIRPSCPLNQPALCFPIWKNIVTCYALSWNSDPPSPRSGQYLHFCIQELLSTAHLCLRMAIALPELPHYKHKRAGETAGETVRLCLQLCRTQRSNSIEPLTLLPWTWKISENRDLSGFECTPQSIRHISDICCLCLFVG